LNKELYEILLSPHQLKFRELWSPKEKENAL